MIDRRLSSRIRPRSQDGWALVTAVTLMAIMLSLGLAAYALVDQGSRHSRQQREKESSLHLAEGVLYSQSLVLARSWPTAVRPYPERCTSETPSTVAQCPNPPSLAAAQDGGEASTTAVFRDLDFLKNGSWGTKVRDNYGAMATDYMPQSADAPLVGPQGTCGSATQKCTWDYNADRQLWVQTRTMVRGQMRNLVALLRLELLTEEIPKAAVAAGALHVSNQNNTDRPTIDGGSGGVYVRCNPNNENTCATYPVNKKTGEGDVQPTPQRDQTRPPLMTAEQLARFEERAIVEGRHWTGCPLPVSGSAIDLSGVVVWVGGQPCDPPPQMAANLVTKPCTLPDPKAPGGTYTPQGGCINSIEKPGILIWYCGRAEFGGNATFVGLLYMVNCTNIGNGSCSPQADSNDVLRFGGNFHVHGAVAVDGLGCFRAGSNGLQILYDRRVFSSVQSFGTAGLVQNYWRELPSDAAF